MQVTALWMDLSKVGKSAATATLSKIATTGQDSCVLDKPTVNAVFTACGQTICTEQAVSVGNLSRQTLPVRPQPPSGCHTVRCRLDVSTFWMGTCACDSAFCSSPRHVSDVYPDTSSWMQGTSRRVLRATSFHLVLCPACCSCNPLLMFFLVSICE